MTDYLFLKSEVTPGTFVSPTGETAIPFLEIPREQDQNWHDIREGGTSRDLYDAEIGARRPKFSIEMRCQAKYLLVLLKSLFNVVTTSTPAGGTNSRDHAFMLNDGAIFTTFSMQTQETRNGSTRTHNWRGCQVVSGEFTFEQDVVGKLKLDMLAFEAKPAGVAFENGNSSPAAITVATPAAVKRSLGFPNVLVTVAPTLTLDGTTKRYSKTGGTALTGIEKLVIGINHGVESRVHLDARYPQAHVFGNRESTFAITLADDTPALTYFHTKIETKTVEPLFLQIDNGVIIEGALTEQLDIALPNALYRKSGWAALSGQHGVRNLEVSGTGSYKSEIGGAVQVQMRDDVVTIS